MLYTRKGDDGKTRLFGNKGRVSKLSREIEVLGALDELNSYLGICRAESIKNSVENLAVGFPQMHVWKKAKRYTEFPTRNLALHDILLGIEHHIFIAQAEVAGAPKTLAKKDVLFLEEITDAVEKIIPPIRSFTLPGATTLSAHLDYARTLARRAERRVRGVYKKRMPSQETLRYLNRLSSALFALARFAAWKTGRKEEKPHY